MWDDDGGREGGEEVKGISDWKVGVRSARATFSVVSSFPYILHLTGCSAFVV